MAKRRTLHQVWVEEQKVIADLEFVWYQNDWWILEKAYDHSYMLYKSETDPKYIMDLDSIYENCYELFEEEKLPLKILYGVNK